MIRIYVGSAPAWARVEAVLEYSIRKHSRAELEIVFMQPRAVGMIEHGCTGFTNTRFAVPELAGFEGFAIYLDVDMLLLAPIEELWQYRQRGHWCVCVDGSTEVAVIDCARPWGLPARELLHNFKKWDLHSQVRYTRKIPMQWNCTDRLEDGAKLIHFTGLDHQPWASDRHPCPEAADLWHQYEKDSKVKQ